MTPIAPAKPTRALRPDQLYVARLFPALRAGFVAGIVLLALYYLTLGLLPAVFAYPRTEFPVAAWAHRFDISQFLGTIPFPPYPSQMTWLMGFGIWLGTLTGCGLVYALLLEWFVQPSDAVKGAGFGVLLCVVLLFGLTLAQGYHPAIMRQLLPDTGVLMLGWSGAALLQMLTLYVLYGLLVGALYRRWAQ